MVHVVDADLKVEATLQCLYLGLIGLTCYILFKVESNLFTEVLLQYIGKRVWKLILGAHDSSHEGTATKLYILDLLKFDA